MLLRVPRRRPGVVSRGTQIGSRRFELDGMANRTHLLRFGVDEDMERLASIIPDAAAWNAPRKGTGLTPVETLKSRHHGHSKWHSSKTQEHLASYSQELFDAIADAVEDDLAFFRASGLFFPGDAANRKGEKRA